MEDIIMKRAAQDNRTQETCRKCGAVINFIRLPDDEWDWCADLGTSLCAATSGNGRHYPVNPVEGIDY